MTEEAQNQLRRNSEFVRAVVKRLMYPFHDRANRHMTFGVRLRIEKNLGMAHVLFVRLF